MRTLFSQSIVALRPAAGGAWFPGLPHAAAAVATWPVFGGSACLAGLLMASLVSFVMWLPLVALALNDGKPLAEGTEAPALTVGARWALFGLWTATAWLAAAVVA